MEIRPATPDDVPHVVPMVERVCAFHRALNPDKYDFLPNPGERYRGWLAQRAVDPRSPFFVAEREPGRLVGFVVGAVEPELGIYRLREFGFIHDLWVDQGYRNEGIARQLVTLAIERFRQAGVEQVRLDVLADNAPAANLFRASGFNASVTEMIRKC